MAAPKNKKTAQFRIRARAYALIVLASVLVVLGYQFAIPYIPILNRPELSARTWIITYVHRFAISGDFVFVALDDATLQLDGVEPEEIAASPELQLMQAEFPWSRKVYASLIERLVQAGARVVAIDVLFTTPRIGDEDLRAVIERYPDRVVLAFNYKNTTVHQGDIMSMGRDMPTQGLLPDDKAKPPRLGFVNFWPDETPGRSDRLAVSDSGVISTFHYKIYDSSLGFAKSRNEQAYYLSFAASVLKMAGLADHFSDKEYWFRDAYNLQSAVPIISLSDIFVPALWKANLKDGKIFKNKIVVIGPLGDRFHDRHFIPRGAIPGPLLHVYAMSAMLENAFYNISEDRANFLIICGIGLLIYFAALPIRRFWLLPLLMAFLLLIYLGAVLLLFEKFSLLLPLVSPSAALVVSGVSLFAYQYARDLVEKSRTRRTLERYVSRNLVQEILDDQGDFAASLAGTRKNVAVLFSDIRGFTRYSENRDPHEVVKHLNEYLTAMVDVVFKHTGTLDKFVGDAVMAVWGNVHSEGAEKDTVYAVEAAIEMLSELQCLNEKWKLGSGEKFSIGIGINYGSVVFGNIGSEQKSDLTVIGDTVNLASRIESSTKFYRVPILLGEALAEVVKHRIPLRFVARVAVKGRLKELDLFTPVLNAEHALYTPPWLEAYEQGTKYFRDREFLKAKREFEKCSNADDELTRRYLAACEKCLVEPPSQTASINLHMFEDAVE
ncbi:MAG: adenylate/guanylate cyclase domain-containing protein [Chthoniobacterales bacterium]